MPAKSESNNDGVKALDFEQALEQLEAVVGQLEEGQLGLNEALEKYERGVKLLRRCYELLEGAERRIELLSGVDAEGRPLTEPFEHAGPSVEVKAAGGRKSHAERPHVPPDRGDLGASTTDMDG